MGIFALYYSWQKCVCVCVGGGGGGVGKRVNTVSSLISAGNYANTCNFTSKEVTVSILVS